MPTQQRIVSLQIELLKNLVDVTIDFEEDKKLTAILGPNGFGKSTILHALAASFQPIINNQGGVVSRVGEDYRYPFFFPNTPHGVWAKTKFSIVHFFREGPVTNQPALLVHKDLGQWFPQAKFRPQREIYFIGVSSSTPAIELERRRGAVKYTTLDLSDAQSTKVKENAGIVLNRNYTRYHTNRLSKTSSFIGVEFEGVNYSALSMGAGEQRVFRLLTVIEQASPYALILIDEIDLLLHTDALHRLLSLLNDYAGKKKLQIVFTTHRESMVHFDDFVAMRHLYRGPLAPHKTFCFNDTKPDAIYRLTGQIERPLQVSCEDDVSIAIVQKIAEETQVSRFVYFSRFGAGGNCFTLAAALLLNGQNLDRSLFVLDGDTYLTQAERQNRIRQVLTGNETNADAKRQSALARISQLQPAGVHPPEHALHVMVTSIPVGADASENEVINVAAQLVGNEDPKIKFEKLLDRLGGSKERAIGRVIDVAAKSVYWRTYTQPVRTWFDAQRPTVIEN
jgi:ABC-type lipoprotein export system ATPase subunit